MQDSLNGAENTLLNIVEVLFVSPNEVTNILLGSYLWYANQCMEINIY